MKTAVFTIICISLIIASCSGKLVNSTSSIKDKGEAPKNLGDEVSRTEYLNDLFDYWRSNHENMSLGSPISIDTVPGYYLIKVDSSIIYLEKKLYTYLPLFRDGRINSKIIYPILKENVFAVTSWEKNSLTISNIEELENLNNKVNQRKFELVINIGKPPCFGPSAEIFYLELSLMNLKSMVKDDIEKFVLKGEVTAFSISLNKRI